MADHVIAVALLATVAVTVGALVRYRQRPFPWLRVLFGVVLWAILSSFMLAIAPSKQILLITYFCFAMSVSVPLSRRNVGLALLGLTLAMVLVVPRYAKSRADWTFTHKPANKVPASLVDHLERLGREDDQVYAPGWLADLPFAVLIPPEALRGHVSVSHPRWHSPVTGIYLLEKRDGVVWFSGGRLRDARQSVEIRER